MKYLGPNKEMMDKIIKDSTPARADIAATKQTLSIDSVLENEYEGWQLSFLRNSFYLPVQVLKDDRFKVEPIKVTTGKEFEEFCNSSLSCEFQIQHEGCNMWMLYAAKQVGVSARQIVATGEKILVCKLWYGRI